MALHIAIITPDKTMYDGEASGVTLPTVDGEITILESHEPLLSLLSSGEAVIHRSGTKQHLAIHGGIVEVREQGVRILTDAAELEEEIDERRAAEALASAKKMREEAADRASEADSTGAIERALARLKIAERRKLRHRSQ